MPANAWAHLAEVLKESGHRPVTPCALIGLWSTQESKTLSPGEEHLLRMAQAHKSGRKSPMKLRVDIEIQGELLVATAHGTLSFHEGQRALKQVLGQAHKKQMNQVLIDMLAVDGVPTTLERYELAKQMAAYIRQHQMNSRIAFVGKPPTADGFAVHVAQNLGISTEILPTRQKALNWLAAWPNPPRTKSVATAGN